MSLFSNYISRFGKNFIWLFLVNKLSYLFSFLTLPILISKYGLKEMGVIFTIQSLVLAMAAIANYSFVYYIPTVSKQISNTEDNAFSNLWNLTISIRLLISILFGVLSLAIVNIYFNDYFFLWLLSLSILLPKVINPSLFCNALEKNKIIFTIGFYTKLLFLLLIIFTDNAYFVNLFFGLSELFVLFFFLTKVHPSISKTTLVSIKTIFNFLKKTGNLFLVNVFSLLKPASIAPTISYLLGAEFVTLYTLADKVINVIRGISGAVFVSFFPIYNKENIKLRLFISKKTYALFSLSLLFTIAIWITSPYLIYYLNNFNYNILATKTLKYLAISIPAFFIVIPLFSYVLHHKKWKTIVRFALLQLFVLFGLIFLYHQSITQIAINFVVSEYVLLFLYGFFIFSEERR